MTTDAAGEPLPTIATPDLPGAKRLADLASIYQDLGFVVGCCDRLLAQMATADPDHVLVQALWSSAVIAYVRCFTTGKRGPLQRAEVLALGLEGEVAEWDQWLHDMRNKYIAHSVNPFEVVLVGTVLAADYSRVEGIATLSTRYLTPDDVGVTQLRDLARRLQLRVGTWATDAQSAVVQAAQQQDPDELKDRPSLGYQVPAAAAAGQPRQ